MTSKANFYPAKASLTEAVESARAALPITDQNTLNAILLTYHNTLIKTVKESVGASVERTIQEGISNEANESKASH